MIGLTRGSTRAHLVRAVLEAITYQVRELTDALSADTGSTLTALKVDGGGVRNDFLMQLQADILGVPVERPLHNDTTVQGAAFAAGLGAGVWKDYQALVSARPIERLFLPDEHSAAQRGFAQWQRAVERSKGWV